ncbi:hypothetical protein M405DRAFT_847906 [Rhizopogon salebrosus TDB-379]|nr:hypothetical protein M405DRAFT_847906 [Rhizopogon salebrosus TDB-379]
MAELVNWAMSILVSICKAHNLDIKSWRLHPGYGVTIHIPLDDVTGSVYIGSDLNITTTTLCCNQVGGTTPSANGSCVQVVDQALNTNMDCGCFTHCFDSPSSEDRNIIVMRHKYSLDNESPGAVPSTLGPQVLKPSSPQASCAKSVHM